MQQTRPPARIKMLVIDIDGTLLNPAGIITARAMQAVRAAHQAGVVVALATARRYWNTLPIAKSIDCALPLILYDGAMLVAFPQSEVLATHTLPSSIAQQAVDIMARHGIQPVVHPETGLQEEIWTGPAEFDHPEISTYFRSFSTLVRRVPLDQLCTAQPGPLRVVAFASENVIAGIVPEIRELDCSWNSITRGSYGTGELVAMQRGCTKASGVMALAQHYGIDLEQVMTIGDNSNDIPMLRVAGWGVAMGQAPESVQAAAKMLTASNAEDGAALAIERYVLE